VRSSAPLVGVVLITMIAMVLRLATLNVQSPWLDETLTIHLIHHGFRSMLGQIANSESNPPLYYALAWVWTRAFGTGLVALRTLSALAGSATVPLAYVAGRRFGMRAGVWAALLVAVSPEMFYYSQEARAYALMILLTGAALVAWQRAMESESGPWLRYWALFSSLAVMTHYFAAFVFVAEAGLLLRRRGWRPTAPAIGSVTLVGIVLAPLAVHQQRNGADQWLTAIPLASRVAQTGKAFLLGPHGPWGYIVAPIVTGLAAGGLALLVVSVLGRDRDRDRRRLFELGAVAATAIGLPLALSLVGLLDVFDGRNVLGAWLPFTLLLATGVAMSRRRWLGNLIGIGLCAVGGALIAGTETMPAYQRDDWRGAARALPAVAPGGRLVVSGRFSQTPLSVYRPDLSKVFSLRVVTREIDFVTLRRAYPGLWRPSEDSLSAVLPPASPTWFPSGFRLVMTRRTASYAVYRLLAPSPRAVNTQRLRLALDDPQADVSFEP
jgi:mannosyltransferase